MNLKNKNTRVFLIENALVIMLVGSAIALQIVRSKNGSKRDPLLLKVAGLFADSVVTWPISNLF